MAALTLNVRTVLSLRRLNSCRHFYLCQKQLCTTEENIGENKKVTLSKFAQAYDKHSKLNEPPPEESFASLLRKSKFIDLGNPEGKEVIGTIYRVVEEDLYIDFGWKFPTVCRIPKKNQEAYTVGAKVKLVIKDLELSTRFLGGTTDITLNEADCILLGVI